MLTWFFEELFSFKRKVVQQEAQDHQTVVQLFVFSMSISFESPSMITFISYTSSDILMI